MFSSKHDQGGYNAGIDHTSSATIAGTFLKNETTMVYILNMIKKGHINIIMVSI